MPKASPLQSSFTAGEVSPLVLARGDLDRYANSLATCYNGLPFVQGGWTRRPGFLFLKTTKFGGSKTSRLFEFEYNNDQAYVLEFGDLYIRFFTLQGILTETAQSIEAITQADPGVITITGHGYSNGDRLHIDADVGGMTQLRLREVIVANKTANTFEIQDIYGTDIDTSGYDAYTAGGTVAKPLEIVTPYAEADLDGLRITQTADTLYIFHRDYNPRQLTRTSATSFTLTDVDFLDGPYLPLNTTSTTLNPSAATGSGITITASSTTGINDGDGFKSTDVGRLIRMDHSGTWGYAKITAFNSTTSVDADVKSNFGASTAQTTWRLGAWSDTTGYPHAGAFFQDRLWAGGTDLEPQRVDGSMTGLYTDFSPSDTDSTVADDNAVSFSFNSETVNEIEWMSEQDDGLVAGTSGGEWKVRASLDGEAVTPSNVNAAKTSSYGSANVEGLRAGDAILFVQRTRRKLREIAAGERNTTANDLTVLSEHITAPAVTELSYQAQPQSVVWATRSDGVLLGMTYEREHGVVGWSRHEAGGVGDAAGAIAEVESIASIPAPNVDRDETYAIVKRYVNGTTERYVELMTKIWETGDAVEDAFYVDSGLTFTGTLTEIVGLWHLEGETVQVLVDGAVHAPQTVTNGKFSLDVTGSVVTVGLDYNSDGETMPIEAGAADGTAQGKIKRISRIGFWLLDTLTLFQGPDTSNLSQVLFRDWGGDWGTATPLFTGVVRETFEGDYDRLGQIYWRANGPLPCNVLGIMPQVQTQDDS